LSAFLPTSISLVSCPVLTYLHSDLSLILWFKESEERRSLGRSRRRWKDNVKYSLEGMG
jgi:hypothetical protein